MRAVGLLAAAALAAVVGAGTAQAAGTPRTGPTLPGSHATTGASSQVLALRAAPAASRVRVGVELTQADLSNPGLLNLVATDFSAVTPEAPFRWQVDEPSAGAPDLASAESVAAWAHNHDLAVRGSIGVWDHPNKYPSYLDADYRTGGAAAVAADMKEHIDTELAPFAPGGPYAGEVDNWNVVNEPLSYTPPTASLATGSVFDEALGAPGYIAAAFGDAYAVDPTANLCLNEDGVTGMSARSTFFYELVAKLLHQGVPINCVGFETHLSLDAALTGHVTQARVAQNFARFAALPTPSGRPLNLQITELDVRLPTNGVTPVSPQLLEQQAWAYAGIMRACLSVPECTSFTTWGIDDGESWVPGHYLSCPLPAAQRIPGDPICGAALLLNDAMTPKPAYDAVLQALGTRSSAELTRTGAQLRGDHRPTGTLVSTYASAHTTLTLINAGDYTPSISATPTVPGERATVAINVDGRRACLLRFAGRADRMRSCQAVALAAGSHRVAVREIVPNRARREQTSLTVAALGLSPVTALSQPAGATSGRRTSRGWLFTGTGSVQVPVDAEQDSRGVFRLVTAGASSSLQSALRLSVDGRPWRQIGRGSGVVSFRGALTTGEHLVTISLAKAPGKAVALRHLTFDPVR